jgi:NO-binding membrane sensor protein with MHYT domain
MRHSRKVLFAVALGVAMAIGGSAYAFTASNTVPASTAGAGTGAVTGFTVSALHYTLDATTPGNIDSLTFTISPAVATGGTVQVSAALTTGGPDTYTCTASGGGTTVTCATTSPQLTAALLNNVTVIAAQ